VDPRRPAISSVGGVNPPLTIRAIACGTADRIKTLTRRGELRRVFGEFCTRAPQGPADAYRKVSKQPNI
jgi:hypothetical protein